MLSFVIIIGKMEYPKAALILGGINHGAIQTSLRTQNYYIYNKILVSSVKNWESICKLIEDDVNDKLIVLGKFTEYTLFQMCFPEYNRVVNKLISLLHKKQHILFIYKNNLLGDFSSYGVSEGQDEFEPMLDNNLHHQSIWLKENNINDSYDNYLQRVRELVHKMNSELNVLPYEKIIDIEISGQKFLEYVAEGLLFRIFIPDGRIWSNEFDRFIVLFKDYASNISNIKLKITQDRLDTGIVCSVYSKEDDITEDRLNLLFKEFSSFMDICASNPQEAERIINQFKINSDYKIQIIQKYIKEAQRLLLDIKHDREQKIMRIKHRLEVELQESELSIELNNYVNNLISNPKFENILLDNSKEKKIESNTKSIYINHVDKIIYQELNGNINLSKEDEIFIEIMEKYSNTQAELSILKTALFELKDKEISKENKRSAWQKLYGFLGKVGSKIGDVGVSLLTKYLEQNLNS